MAWERYVVQPAPEQYAWGLSARILVRLRGVFRGHGVREVLLFGSRATGNFHTGSDIDLCVKDRLTKATWTQLCSDVDSLDLLFGIDLVHFDEVPEAMRANIEGDGVSFMAPSPEA